MQRLKIILWANGRQSAEISAYHSHFAVLCVFTVKVNAPWRSLFLYSSGLVITIITASFSRAHSSTFPGRWQLRFGKQLLSFLHFQQYVVHFRANIVSRTRKNFELIKGALFLLDLVFVHSAPMQYRQYHSASQKSTSFCFHHRHGVACTFYQSQPIRYPLGFVGAQFFLGARMATAGRNLKVHFANHFHNFSFHLFMITVFPLFFSTFKRLSAKYRRHHTW